MFLIVFLHFLFVKKEEKREKQKETLRTKKNNRQTQYVFLAQETCMFSIKHQMQVIPLSRNQRDKQRKKK